MIKSDANPLTIIKNIKSRLGIGNKLKVSSVMVRDEEILFLESSLERAKKEHDLLLLRTKQVYILVEALNKNEINQDDYILLIGKIYDTGISGSIDEELEALK